MDLETRAKTRMETDDDKQWLNVLQWAKKNPTKDVDIYALDAEERDRIRARLISLNGEQSPPANILVHVKPADMNTPIHVRV